MKFYDVGLNHGLATSKILHGLSRNTTINELVFDIVGV